MSSESGVFIIHRIPGRVRIGVPSLRKDPALGERLAQAARESRWITGARVNPWAASLTIEHDPGVPLEAVLSSLARVPELSACGAKRPEELARKHLQPAEPPSPSRTATMVCRAAVKVNAASSVVAPPHVDLKILIPGALVGFGLYRVLTRGASGLPHWITLVKYGFDTFALLNHGLVQSFLAGNAGSAGGKMES